MVEGRYWSFGVGGLWGFKGGWPGCLERQQAGECGMDRTVMMPTGPGAGRLGCKLWLPSASAEAWGPHPLPRGPALFGLHFIYLTSPTSLSHSPNICPLFHLGMAPPSSLLPPVSVHPALCRPPASHYLGQMGGGGPWSNPPQLLNATRALCPVGWALPRWAPSVQAAQQRQRKQAEDPASLGGRVKYN